MRPSTSPAEIVEPPARQAWDEKGWTKTIENGVTVYYGNYRVFDRRKRGWREFEGYVREFTRKTMVYIKDPPKEIHKHPKGACFMLVQSPWFYLNWARGASNVDDAILYLKKVLWESFNVY